MFYDILFVNVIFDIGCKKERLNIKFMIIEKKLNNNVVITKNLSGMEIIIMGRGIAFGSSVGDEIDESKIEKTFTLNSDKQNRLVKILSSIPMEHILISEKIINKAKIMLGKTINENIYITLSEHISCAILRHKKGKHIENPLKWDIKKFYQKEYQAACMAQKIIFEDMAISLLDDEIAVFALDFVGAEQKNDELAYNMTKIMKDICNMVSKNLKVDFDENSLQFFRFITHLRFFAQRILTQTHYDDNMTNVLHSVAGQNQKAFECTKKINDYLIKEYDFEMTSDEMLYLCLHILRF